MSKKIKNIIMISIIIILLFTISLTVYYAKNSINRMDNIPSDMRVQNGDNKNPMDMPSESMEEPPEKPDNLTDNMEEPPEKPDSSDKNIEQPPEKMNDKNNIPSNKISTKYYILFSVQSLLLIMLLSYLILSKCNKYTLKTSFKSTSIVVIYVILVIVLSACLTYIETYVTKESNDIKRDNINNVSVNYSAYKEITENIDIANEEMNSSNSDENVLLLTGNIKSNIENISVKKTGDSSLGDTTSFYGVNSAIVATSGANVTIKNINVETDAIGANGIFSYGGNATTNNNTTDNTTINIYDSTITTKKDNSGGIMTTGGGNTNAYNLTINTSGTSSAAIRSDRGGGNVYVDRGTYTTTGIGSPAIYSTAKIVVENSNLISKASEGIIIEGKNSVEINNCNLTDTNTKLNGLSTTYKNIFLYQSMSGDASEGTSIFTATDSKIITNNGDTFYVTNTSSTINLTNNEIINNDKKGYFLRVSSDSWGNKGSNGGSVTLTLNNQKIIGDIYIDEISDLNMNIKDNSNYEGSINSNNTAKNIVLSIDETSNFKLTSDCYVTMFDNKKSDNSNIDFNGYSLYVNNKKIN